MPTAYPRNAASLAVAAPIPRAPPVTIITGSWLIMSHIMMLGCSSAKLDVLRAWMKTQHTTALMASVGGHVLFEYGDVKLVSVVASVRKSILAMMYGKYVANGTIDLNKTVKEVGLDDLQKFLPIEERATLAHLLMS